MDAAGVELDKYDHVFSNISLNVNMSYAGMTYTPAFENGTTYSMIHFWNREIALSLRIPEADYPCSAFVHEFLHTASYLSKNFGAQFDLHGIREKFYMEDDDRAKVCYTDIILNQARGDEETGTGVLPIAWQYPPHVIRTMSEWIIPEGVTAIGEYAFQDLTNLEKVTIPNDVTSIGTKAFRGTGLTSVTIPGSVTNIDVGAFAACDNLNSVTISSGVTSIGTSVFYDCVSLKSVSIPASVTSIEGYAFYGCTALNDIYYGGTQEQWNQISIGGSNSALTKANIHYNSKIPDTTATPNTPSTPSNPSTPSTNNFTDVASNAWYAEPVAWAVANNITAGTSSFTDVPAGVSYAQAVAWAVKVGVTSGTSSTTFSPDQTCTRGQIVTFLYRALA